MRLPWTVLATLAAFALVTRLAAAPVAHPVEGSADSPSPSPRATHPSQTPSQGGGEAEGDGERDNARTGTSVPADFDAVVLCYHHVEEVAKNDFTVTVADFKKQLDWLATSGYHVVSLGSVVDALRGKARPPPSPAVVITFDDGWRCAFENAIPLILERHWPVTLYLYPALVHKGSHIVTAQEYKELAKNPQVTIACHSQTHPNSVKEQAHLDKEAYAKFLDVEFARSKQVLSTMIGIPIEHLAYPYGIYDTEIMKVVAGAGFVSAATINASPNGPGTDPMLLNRCMIMKGDGLKGFVRKVQTLPLRVTAIDPADGAIVPQSAREFRCTLADPSQIAGKPSMIAGQAGAVTYEPQSGEAKITIAGPLKMGVHQVAIWGKDPATGRARRASWQVRVR